MKPDIRWVVPVRSIVVTAEVATSLSMAFYSVAATSSLGVEFGDPVITLALAPSWFLGGNWIYDFTGM